MNWKRPSRPRVGLLGKFALASLLAIIVLGIVLAHVLGGQIRERALVNARESAALLESSLVQPQLTAAAFRTRLSPDRVAALDASLHQSVADRQIARIKIWGSNGRAVYATDHAIIGKRFAVSKELGKALGGEPASVVSDVQKAESATDRQFGKLLEVYTPVRFGANGRVAGAFELSLPYLPIQAAIGHDLRRLYLILAGGLALLYLTLFQIAARASRRLRGQALDLGRQAAENKHLAFHDPLTDLPNRSLFTDRAGQAILAARREQRTVALMLLDLDRFKEVNDTLGHHNGDGVLREIGKRLESALRASDTVARLGGDEFGLLLPTVSDAAAALSVADEVRQKLRRPFVLGEITLDLEASVGIALFPDHGEDVEALLQRADVAMYLAKEDRSGCELYAAARDEYSPARLGLVGELRHAIDRGELLLHYQPKGALATGTVQAFEALVRWQHPVRGLIGPDEFIPLAERTGLIRSLTHLVLDQALSQVRDWEAQGIELGVSVNLSARDLLDLQLPTVVERLLDRYGITAERLELEITESVILADPMRARAVLSRLDAMGVQLAIDDYGSGYSSLAYLKRLPVTEIKIDRSFVVNMQQDENDAVIVRSTIDLGRNLGLRVVAEGVENEDVWNELARLQCDEAQGYYLSRPIPGDEVAGWLARRSASPERPPLAQPSAALLRNEARS